MKIEKTERKVEMTAEVTGVKFNVEELKEILVEYAKNNGVRLPEKAVVDLFGLRDRVITPVNKNPHKDGMDGPKYLELIVTEIIED